MMVEYDRTDPLIYKMAFGSLRGLMLPVASRLLEVVGSEQHFFEMSSSELSAISGFSNRLFGDSHRAALLERARREFEFVASRQIDTLYFTDDHYPQRLTNCDDAPLMMYGCGNCDLNSVLPVAIVGTRHATAYGVDFVKRLVKRLAEKCRQRVLIVSGLAFGIDVAAHLVALDADLPTVAVVAHGLNTIYPAQHRSIAADIIRKGGMLLTEYASSEPVHKGNFLARNRIIAGMCDVTIVAESARKGGALVTARIAGAYNRDVFALPGRTTDKWSEGCNDLIADNAAHLITDADQLIEAMGWTVAEIQEEPKLFEDLSDEEQRLIDWLTDHPDAHLNDIAVALNIAHGRLNGLLLELEFKDMVICKPGARYCAINKR